MWVVGIPPPNTVNTPFTGTSHHSAIIKGGYLIRKVVVKEDKLFLTGDLTATTTIEIIGGAPENLASLHFNGKSISFKKDKRDVVSAEIEVKKPTYSLPDLSSLKWKVVDSLPETKADYSDSKWTPADLSRSFNDKQELFTPTSLFASDYGYNWGYTLFRGTFQSTGAETSFTVRTRGALAFGVTAWIDDHFLGSYAGHGEVEDHLSNFTLPKLKIDEKYTFTIVIDNMGHNQNWNVGVDETKLPIGILDYYLSGRGQQAISWKITGNFKGEDYLDRERGPANEGGLWAERHGYHLPAPPSESWTDSKGPTEGLEKAGIAFYSTSFDLDIPRSYDIPIAIQVGKKSEPLVNAAKRHAYRLQIYVNGWQFGKYVNNIGPQVRFPVPEGIWNYRGKNWLAISLWNLEDRPVKVEDLKLVAGPEIYTGLRDIELVHSPKWTKRGGAY
jgi:Beta-galactosidase jelly roll domain/Beta-galactosidase, domain 3